MNFSYMLLHSVSALVTIAAFIYIVTASAKLARIGVMPGAKLIFGAVIVIIISILMTVYINFLGIEESVLIEGVINICSSAAFLVGARGFSKMAKYLVSAKNN